MTAWHLKGIDYSRSCRKLVGIASQVSLRVILSSNNVILREISMKIVLHLILHYFYLMRLGEKCGHIII
jgi:hypothetical protein